tara:strand:+ start:1077 stop:1490 length:414 start_codon:yes stop_codon:yes gene_type:complete
LKPTLRLGQRAGEAMNNYRREWTRRDSGGDSVRHCDQIIVRLPLVHENRAIELHGKLKLRSEAPHLHRLWAFHAVVIEAALTYGNGERIGEHVSHRPQRSIARKGGRVVRMHSHCAAQRRRVQLRPLLHTPRSRHIK